MTTDNSTFRKAKVLVGKDDVPTGSVVLLPMNVGVASDHGLIVGLVDVLAVVE